MAFDPHPNLQDLIVRFHEREAMRPPGTPIRIIRSTVLKTRYWREDVGFLKPQRGHPATSPDVEMCDALASAGERLGVAYVGLVTETREELS